MPAPQVSEASRRRLARLRVARRLLNAFANMKKLAFALLACAACATQSPSTQGTWSVTMQLSDAACGDAEPGQVNFLVRADLPGVATAGLVAATTVAVECGGPGQPTTGPTPNPSDEPFVPATTVHIASDNQLVFDVDTSTVATDPMVTTYSMTLQGDELVGTAAYHANATCTDSWTLTATRGD